MKVYSVLLFAACIACASFCGCTTYPDYTAASPKAPDDHSIVTDINNHFDQNSLLNPYSISVSSRDGVVTLEGLVPDATVAAVAVSIARGTQGVKDVKDNIRRSR